jgi:hypothetical protein
MMKQPKQPKQRVPKQLKRDHAAAQAVRTKLISYGEFSIDNVEASEFRAYESEVTVRFYVTTEQVDSMLRGRASEANNGQKLTYTTTDSPIAVQRRADIVVDAKSGRVVKNRLVTPERQTRVRGSKR